jgi:hypothetical protein
VVGITNYTRHTAFTIELTIMPTGIIESNIMSARRIFRPKPFGYWKGGVSDNEIFIFFEDRVITTSKVSFLSDR